jgi:hypothetical protein
MPDGLGRHTLAEMRELVRRYTDMVYNSTISAAGKETGVAVINPLVTDTDLTYMLNSALSKRSIDIALSDETLMSDREYIDVLMDVVEYPLPVDLVILRGLYWKMSGVTMSVQPPAERYTMHLVNGELPAQDGWGVPTYRRMLDRIVLNTAQVTDNIGAIMIEYVKWPLPLITDDQVLETVYARALQEVLVLDTAIDVVIMKLRMNPELLLPLRNEWLDRLTGLIRSAYIPEVVRMVPKHSFIRRNR